MNQNDFRALLATSSSRGDGDGDGDGGGAYGGKRNMSEADLNEIRRLSKKPKAKGKKKKEQPPEDETRKTKDATGYRDRAAERRQGLNTDMISTDEYAHFDAEQTKFLGGDMEHTHLVKGLDFALLAQLKREKEKLLQATQQAKASSTAHSEVRAGQQQPAEKPITFKSRMGRSVYFHAVQSTTMSTMLQQSGAQRKSEHFLPGRMYYTFNLASAELESIPTIVQRSKDDFPDVDELVSGIVDELVISKVGDALNNSKHMGAKKLRKKKKTKGDGDGVDDHERMNEDEDLADAQARSSGVGGTVVDDDDDDDDEDIFPDVGEYVPIGQRDEKEEERNTTASGVSSGYFNNLSASISAAEQAEQQREAEAEHAWKQTIRKVAEAQSNAERERKDQERKQKEARAGLQVDEYSECYPEYQAAAALDSEDDEEVPRKGADKDMDDETKEGEKQRRKKQKQGNKLQNDLEKINKIIDAKETRK